MSVVNHLIDGGLFEELSTQPSNDTVRLGVNRLPSCNRVCPQGRP